MGDYLTLPQSTASLTQSQYFYTILGKGVGGSLYWKQEPLNVWKYLAIPCKYRCNWQSISECKCKNNSCSILRRFRALTLTLNAMKIDDLIQNIVEAIERRMEDISLEDAIDKQLKEREDAIVSKFKIAHQRLEKRGYDEESLLRMLNHK